jgi:hypothetical protein
MTATIVNAAPMTIMLGTQDKSTRALVAEAEVLPQHLPKVYLYTKKGPTDPQLVVGSSRAQMYGEDSFDLRKPWATHQTVLSNSLTAAANAQMIQRIQPADAAPPASIRLFLDLLETQVDNYERNIDGSVKLDATTGLPVISVSTPKIAGHKAKWVVAQILPGEDGEDLFGQSGIMPGDQTDSTTSTQSQRYPIMDLRVPSFGSYGNNIGLRLWAPTTKSGLPVDERVLSNEKVYPFRMACVERATDISTPRIVETLSAEQFVNVCFKPATINRTTDTELYAGDVFIQAYQDLTNPSLPPQFGPFGKLHMYDANIATVLGLVYAAEVPFVDGFSDFQNEEGEEFRFNLISGTSSAGVPYHSYQVVTGTANSVRLSETATVYAQGGSDGTMSEALFSPLVADAVREYANENSILQDIARYPENIIYDTGFTLDTKYALCSFISVRKDTAVVLSTHDVLGKALTASEESALGIALRTRLQMYPESEFFGTSTMRGMIVGRCCMLLKRQ